MSFQGMTRSSFHKADESNVGPYDVICGRSKAALNNTGNRRFRITVSMHVQDYVKAANRKDKTRIVRSCVESVHNSGGLFLQLRHGEWVELNQRESHEKVGHALRDMSATQTRKQKKDTTTSDKAAVKENIAALPTKENTQDTTPDVKLSRITAPATIGEIKDCGTNLAESRVSLTSPSMSQVSLTSCDVQDLQEQDADKGHVAETVNVTAILDSFGPLVREDFTKIHFSQQWDVPPPSCHVEGSKSFDDFTFLWLADENDNCHFNPIQGDNQVPRAA